MSRFASWTLAASLLVGAGGCVPPLPVLCPAFEGSDIGFAPDSGVCCFVDADQDGVGTEEEAPLDGDGTCSGESVSVFSGDCDDDDDLRYPGQFEVCDGVDNDCNGEADYDDAGEVSGVESLMSCSPSGGSGAMFFGGSGRLNGQRVGHSGERVRVSPGGDLSGTLQLHALYTGGENTVHSAAFTWSWEPERHLGWRPIWGWDEWAAGTSPPPGWSRRTVEIAPIEVPEQPGEYLLTLAGASTTDAIFLASMVAWNWSDTTCTGGPNCASAIWNDPNPCCGLDECPEGVTDDDGDGIADGRAYMDLAAFTTWELAACIEHGSAPLRRLGKVSGLDGPPLDAGYCPIPDDDYDSSPTSCAFVIIEVADDE